MRFKQHLTEKVVDDIDNSILKKAIKSLCKKFKIKSNELDYIGYADVKFKGPNAKLLYFNILKPGHIKYKSTVGYQHNFKG